MDFEIPTELADYLKQLDDFIEREIKPLEQADDNIRFFDHRRENARTDWDREGLPNQDWEELLAEARRRADAAGRLRDVHAHDRISAERSVISASNSALSRSRI